MNPLYLIPALVLLVLLRARWVTWQIQDYTARSLYWCFRTKQGTVVAHEMSQLWPMTYLLCEIWRWDFRRYVIYQGHFDEMMIFTMAELSREDRGWEIFDSAKDSELDKPDQKQR